MKELYISDLDGTLLGSDAKLSKQTVAILNELIANGLNFTIATARARETVLEVLNELDLKLPIVLMNGVIIYDPVSKAFLNAEYMGTENAKKVAELFKAKNLTGLMYKLIDGETITYFESLDHPAVKAFYKDRVANSHRKFVQTKSFVDIADENTIYFVLIDKLAPIKKVEKDIQKMPGVINTMYEDVYTQEEKYYFEVFSDKASKATAALFLKQHLDARRIISFGDNYNDMSLFEASDECYAVSNARDELKQIATSTIGSCRKDGVPLFLKERFAPLPDKQ